MQAPYTGSLAPVAELVCWGIHNQMPDSTASNEATSKKRLQSVNEYSSDVDPDQRTLSVVEDAPLPERTSMPARSTMFSRLSSRKSKVVRDVLDRGTDGNADDLANRLFEKYDTAHDGTLEPADFQSMFQDIKKHVVQEVEAKEEARREAQQNRRQLKYLGVGMLVLLAFLLLSISSTLAIVVGVVNDQVRTTNLGDVLVVKGHDEPVQVAVKTDSNHVLLAPGSTTAPVQVALRTESLPLIVAPLLAFDTLADVKEMTVSYFDKVRAYPDPDPTHHGSPSPCPNHHLLIPTPTSRLTLACTCSPTVLCKGPREVG